MRKLLLILASSLAFAAPGFAAETVTLQVRDGIERPALYTDAEGARAAVLVHQSGRSNASWEEFSDWLAQEGTASVALSSVAAEDVRSGIDFLRGKGRAPIILVGASIGGGAVQNALHGEDSDAVSHVILLGTADGKAIEQSDIEKLFLGSEQDFFGARAVRSFDKAAEPKTLILLPGRAHGQELLEGETKEQAMQLIAAFLEIS